ncbi:MAG: serine/threonine protein kinase [Gemmataceae bacterium]|nr:serine/threonine protein kinase [Gemmataceae bacterium]
MAAPNNNDEFLDLVRKSGVVEEKRLDTYLQKARSTFPPDPSKVAGLLVRDSVLTHFQAEQILQGKWRRFTIGKYKVLERLGSGGMGSVYLCEHKLMRRRVAVKVLPTAKAADPSSLDRFYREARAVAALDHPNIVHAYDIDQDEQLHFLVMEHVDGASLQEIVKKSGPLAVLRACHYIRQSALGLHHAHEAGLVHRDIKPGNILVDRSGLVKILDMGLARFFNDEEDILTKKYDENVLGTADYLAPEQALDSHSVDIRADIYSLGATFYFMLTGRTPFGEGTVAQKLLWHQNRQPKLVAEFRNDVPTQVLAIISKMMAKEADKRFQIPMEVANVLAPFTQIPIGPPPESEMPNLSPAATGVMMSDGSTDNTAVTKNDSASSPKALQGMTKPPSSPSAAPTRPATPAPRAASAPPPSPKPMPAPAAVRTTPAVPKTPSPAPVAPRTPSGTVTASRPQTPVPPPAPPIAPTPLPSPIQPGSALDFSVGKHQPRTTTTEGEPEENGFADFAPDTDNFVSQGDTAPASAGRRKGATAAPVMTSKSRLIFRIASVAFVVLAIAGTAIWWFVQPPATPVRKERAPQTLVVTRDEGKKAFRTIEHALRSAKPGDTIQLADDVHKENLTLIKARDIVIQAAPGKEVVWTSFVQNDPATPLIYVNNCENVRFAGKGITLDGTLEGGKKTSNLIHIALESPNVAIEDMKLKHFANAGILMTNAAGQDSRPIKLVRIEGESKGAPQGIYLDANKDVRPPVNDYIEAIDCKFDGVTTPIKTKNAEVLGKNVVGMNN